jgi:hypothetical protein
MNVTLPNPDFISFKGSKTYYQTLLSHGVGLTTGMKCPAVPSSFMPPHQGNLAREHLPFAKLMSQKMKVLAHTFYCRKFRIGPERDENGNPIFIKEAKETCNWKEWNEYLDETVKNLADAAVAVDKAQDEIGDRIVVDLQKIVEDNLLSHIDELEESINCKFVRDRFFGLHDSICLHMKPGSSGVTAALLGLGFICWLAIIVQMITWRKRVMPGDLATPTAEADDDGSGSPLLNATNN